MDRRRFLEFGSLASLGALTGCAATRKTPTPTLEGGFQVLTVEGTPYERGAAHGEALRESIHAAVEGWKGALTKPEGMGPGQYLNEFAGATDFASAIARHTPDLFHEIQGLAAGSGVPVDTIYALQMVDEEWCYATRQQFGESGGVGGGVGDKCSVLARAGDGLHPTYVAQNLDGPGWLAGRLALVRHVERKKELDVLVLTFPGGLALNGMNARGVAVCVNALLTLRSAAKGLPVACVIRGALRRPSAVEAARFVQGVPHASGQCYTIGDPSRVVCLEASAGKVERVGDARGLAHTNHPLANDDHGALGRWVAEQPAGTVVGMLNSEARLLACERRLAEGGDPLTNLRAALGSHDDPAYPVCRHRAPEQTFSAACTIFELSERAPRLHLAADPPCTAEFRTHAL
ncbi:MAG: hypothetical protein HOP15_12130 [Planctomycetes bacterium]|nr:hypothetical protein [Planctomycetota bacterium]